MVKDWKLKDETDIEVLPRADVEDLLTSEATGVDVHHGDETLVDTRETPARAQISRPRLRDLGVGRAVLSFRVEVGIPRPADSRFHEGNERPLSDELREELEQFWGDGEESDGGEGADAG